MELLEHLGGNIQPCSTLDQLKQHLKELKTELAGVTDVHITEEERAAVLQRERLMNSISNVQRLIEKQELQQLMTAMS